MFLISCSLSALGIAQATDFKKMGPVNEFGKTFDNVKVTGPTKLTEVKAKSVSVTGVLTFHNLEISGDLNVTGPIENSQNLRCKNLKATGLINAENIECTTMNLTGSVTLKNVRVSGDAKMTGSIDLTDASFANLNLASNAMNLENVNVNNIIIEETYGTQEQVLNLKGSTSVSGDVTFKSGRGIIIGEDKVNGVITGLMNQEKDEL